VGKVAADGTRARSFSFKRWRGADERVIGAIREENRSISAGAFAAEVLAHFLADWQGESFEGLSKGEKRLRISQSWAADVYAAWFELRRRALSNEFDSRLHCAQCRTPFDYIVDVGSIDSLELEDGEAISTPFALRDGLSWQGQDRKLLTLEPLRWEAYEALAPGNEVNLGTVKLAVCASAIVGLEGIASRVKLPTTALDDLSKFDLESLSAWVNENQPGPVLLIETHCPKCKAPIARSFPWVYDVFFSAKTSSTSAPLSGGAGKSSPLPTACPASPSISTGQPPPTE